MPIFIIISIICEAIAVSMACANTILSRFVSNGNKTAAAMAERASAWLAFVFATADAVIFIGGYIICILASI